MRISGSADISRRNSIMPVFQGLRSRRAANKAKVNIYAARPGIIIGKKGSEIEKLKKDLEET